MRNNRERKSRLEERSKTHIVNEDILRYKSHKKVILLDIEAIACLWIPFKPIHVITFQYFAVSIHKDKEYYELGINSGNKK